MIKELIYLASPYTCNCGASVKGVYLDHSCIDIEQHRYEEACKAVAELTKAGKMVFSPIAHGHGVAKYGLPTDAKYWGDYNRFMLDKCDRLYVLMLDGWDKSKGVTLERQWAKDLGMLTDFMDWPPEEAETEIDYKTICDMLAEDLNKLKDRLAVMEIDYEKIRKALIHARNESTTVLREVE